MTLDSFIDKYQDILDANPLNTKDLTRFMMFDLDTIDKNKMTRLLLDSQVNPLEWLKLEMDFVKCFASDSDIMEFETVVLNKYKADFTDNIFKNFELIDIIQFIETHKGIFNLMSNSYTMAPSTFDGEEFDSAYIIPTIDDEVLYLTLNIISKNNLVYQLNYRPNLLSIRYIDGIGYGISPDIFEAEIADLVNSITIKLKRNLY